MVRMCAADPIAGLVVCTNTNICGKSNPTLLPGYGFAFRAIECLRVLGPSTLVVLPGPCFVRCSRGVNAKLVLPDDAREAHHRGRRLTDGTPYFRLNSVKNCVTWLAEALDEHVEPELLAAYDSYLSACHVLGDSVAGKARGDIEYNDIKAPSSADALAAMPHLDDAVAFADVEPPKGGWPPFPALQRRSLSGSVWVESFYGSRMSLCAVESFDVPNIGSNGMNSPSLEEGLKFAGGSSDRADAALAQARQSLGMQTVRGPRIANGRLHSLSLRGRYGRGRLYGTQTERTFVGQWEEGEGSGDFELSLSDDGLHLKGRAVVQGKAVDWSGERVAPTDLCTRGDARQRWQSRVLSLRSCARLTLGCIEGALEDAAAAVRVCPWLPVAWEAAADAALHAGDARTAAMALEELLYLQRGDASGLPLQVENRRRLQRMALDAIRRGELQTPALRSTRATAIATYILRGTQTSSGTQTTCPDSASSNENEPQPASAADHDNEFISPLPPPEPEDKLRSKLDAIFMDKSYAIPKELAIEDESG